MDSLALIVSQGSTQTTLFLPLPTTLPMEIIEEVIDQANDDPASLRSLSLLCKSLLTRARLHLFTGIVIRDAEHMESSHKFLDSCPWVCPLVQTVILFACVPSHYSKPNIPLLDMIRTHLFTRLPNLRTWTVGTNLQLDDPFEWLRPQLSLHRSTMLCYRVHAGRIENLKLASIIFQDISHFIRLISAFTSIHTLTCTNIQLAKEHVENSSLHDAEILRIFARKPLRVKHLTFNTSTDIRAVEFLLSSRATAMLDSLTARVEGPSHHVAWNDDVYFQRLEGSMSCLTQLSSGLTLSICLSLDDNGDLDRVKRIRRATQILNHVDASHLRDVQVQLQLNTYLAELVSELSSGSDLLGACKALEDALLGLPVSYRIRICEPGLWWRRARRAEFWRLNMASAFPRLNAQGLLMFPRTHASDPLGHESQVSCIATSPDSKWIATAGLWDGTIIVWDVERGMITQEWLAHEWHPDILAFSPDCRRLVSADGAGDETLAVWSLVDRASKVTASGRASINPGVEKGVCGDEVVAASWSPDSALIALASEDGTVSIWDALTCTQRGLFHGPGNYLVAESLQWLPDRGCLGWIYKLEKGVEWMIWNPFTEESPKTFALRLNPINVLSFDPRSGRIAVVYDRQQFHHSEGSERMDEEDGSTGGRTFVHIWDIMTGTLLAVLQHADQVYHVAFSQDSRFLLCTLRNTVTSAKVWDAGSWEVMVSLESDRAISRDGVPSACFSAGGKYIAIASKDDAKVSTVQLWRTGETSRVAVFTEHKTSSISCLAFSPNGEVLVSGDDEGIVHMRRLSNFIRH